MQTVNSVLSNQANRAAVAAIVGAVAVAVGKHFGVDVRSIVEASGISMETAMAAVTATIGGLIIKLNGRVSDQQDRVTKRPAP